MAIEIAAAKAGITEDELVQQQNQQIQDSLAGLGIRCDVFSRTHSEVHQEFAKDFFRTIQANGYLEKRTEEHAYCEHDKRFLPDRYIFGTCPHCGSDKARGDQCESCGKLLDPVDLVNPTCTICGNHDIIKKETYNYYFLLSKFQKPLEEWIATKSHWKPNVYGTVQKWLKEGLNDRCVTRDINR